MNTLTFHGFLAGLAQNAYPEEESQRNAESIPQAAGVISKQLLPGANILQIGCGNGVAADLFRQAGHRVGCIPLSPMELELGRKLGVSVHEIDMHALATVLPAQSFDLVWARHVLERSPAPLFVLQQANHVLKENGFIYLETLQPDTVGKHQANPNLHSVLTPTGWIGLLQKSKFCLVKRHQWKVDSAGGPDCFTTFVCQKNSRALYGSTTTGLAFRTHAGQLNANAFKIGFDLNYPVERSMDRSLSQGLLYEARSIDFLAGHLHPGEVFFDVGAHIGYFTVMMAALVGKGGKVVAFEACRETCQRLRSNAPENTEIMQAACSDKPGRRKLFVHADSDGSHAFWDVSTLDVNKVSSLRALESEVECVTLDDFADRQPHAIKIDVEGAELLVLKGASQVLKQPQLRAIVIEANSMALAQMGTSVQEISTLLASQGFQSVNNADWEHGVSNMHWERP